MGNVCRPISEHTIAQNVFIKRMIFVHKSDSNLFHKHAYDHLTVLSAGALEIRCDNRVGRFRAPHLFLTPKDGVHQFVALEDQTIVSCIHALRDPDGDNEIVSPKISPKEASRIVSKRHDAVIAEIAARESAQNDFLRVTDINDDAAWQPGLEGWCSSNVREAVCADTLVRLCVLSKMGERRIIQAQSLGRIGYVSLGSVKLDAGNGARTYQAPSVLVIPAGQPLLVTSESDYAVIADIYPLRGRDKRPDAIPPEITLEHASERLERVLAQIEQQTTVVDAEVRGLSFFE